MRVIKIGHAMSYFNRKQKGGTVERNCRKPLPSQDYLKRVLNYSPETGTFERSDGHKAGHIHSRGYVEISLQSVDYKAHRLAFQWMTGNCPDSTDHINGDKADNRWENLRPATQSQNMANRSKQRNNTTGYLGVVLHCGKYVATIKYNGSTNHLGRWPTAEDAARVYDLAAIQLRGEYAKTNFPCEDYFQANF